MSKNLNKIWLLISIFTVATCAVLFASTFATAEEPNATYTISGKVVDSAGSPLAGVLASGNFFNPSGEAYITEDATTVEDGTFTISGVIENSYGAIAFYPNESDQNHSGVKYYFEDPIKDFTDIGSVTLPSLTDKVDGKVTDANGNGIPNVTLEFYNPKSVKSPFADIAVKTNDEGNYSLANPITSSDYYKGVSVGSDYYVVAQTGECEKGYISQTADLNVKTEGNVLNFQLDRIVNLKLYDYDQTENGWAEWYHELYINGELQSEGSYLGDSNFQLPLNAKFTFKDNCKLELAYTLGEDEYLDTFVPAFRNAIKWEGQDFNENLIGDYWMFWINEKSKGTPPIECRDGYSYQCDDSTNYLYLDVNFKAKNVEPAVVTPAQTGDENGMLIAILVAVVALAIVGLASYFVINKVKNNKTKSKHPKH